MTLLTSVFITDTPLCQETQMTLLTGKDGALLLSHPLSKAGNHPVLRAEVERKSVTGRDSPQADS